MSQLAVSRRDVPARVRRRDRQADSPRSRRRHSSGPFHRRHLRRGQTLQHRAAGPGLFGAAGRPAPYCDPTHGADLNRPIELVVVTIQPDGLALPGCSSDVTPEQRPLAPTLGAPGALFGSRDARDLWEAIRMRLRGTVGSDRLRQRRRPIERKGAARCRSAPLVCLGGATDRQPRAGRHETSALQSRG